MIKLLDTILGIMEINSVHFLAISLQKSGSSFQLVLANV